METYMVRITMCYHVPIHVGGDHIHIIITPDNKLHL